MPSLRAIARDVKNKASLIRKAPPRDEIPEKDAEEKLERETPERGTPAEAAGPQNLVAPGWDSLDPKLTGIVLACSLLLLWRPSLLLLCILAMGNVVMAMALGTLCISTPTPAPARRLETQQETGDVPSTQGLQQLLTPAWARMREIIAHRDFSGIVSFVDIGEEAPEVVSVRSASSPCEDVVCYDVGLEVKDVTRAAYVQMEVKVPGSSPWTFRMKLLELRITVQLYFWSLPPEGRGSGRPYSLIEGSVKDSQLLRVSLETVSESPPPSPSSRSFLEQFLSNCEALASAVICSQILPRFSGFERRVVLDEARAEPSRQESQWQQSARRAGWQPRAEAAVESAVSQLFTEAGGFAYEAVASTAGSVAAQGVAAARRLKSSLGMDA